MENQQEFILQRHSGLTRAYFKAVDWQLTLPNVSDIMKNPSDYIDLMYHIALNHKGLNWKMYKFQLNPDNYQVFIYSIAFCIMNTKPTCAYSWQMNRNARKIITFASKNNIQLEEVEKSILNLGSKFFLCKDSNESKIFDIFQLVDELHNIYEV